MKKLLLTVLITLSTNILAKTSLLGVYINDNVLDYVTKEELKSKSRDIVRGFFALRLKNPPVSNKYYSDDVFVTFDKNNKIVQILSVKKFQNLETCEKMEYEVRRLSETKNNFEFVRNPNAEYGFYKWLGDNVITTLCNVNVLSDDETILFIFLKTEKYSDKFQEYLLDSKI